MHKRLKSSAQISVMVKQLLLESCCWSHEGCFKKGVLGFVWNEVLNLNASGGMYGFTEW